MYLFRVDWLQERRGFGRAVQDPLNLCDATVDDKARPAGSTAVASE